MGMRSNAVVNSRNICVCIWDYEIVVAYHIPFVFRGLQGDISGGPLDTTVSDIIQRFKSPSLISKVDGVEKTRLSVKLVFSPPLCHVYLSYAQYKLANHVFSVIKCFCCRRFNQRVTPEGWLYINTVKCVNCGNSYISDSGSCSVYNEAKKYVSVTKLYFY